MKEKKYAAISLIVILLMLICPRSSAYHFEYLTNNNGLPHNMVKCIEQDELGFMWFGTKAGLSRYDGYNFHSFVLDSSSSYGMFIKDLCYYQDGMWAISNDKIWCLDLNTRISTEYRLGTYKAPSDLLRFKNKLLLCTEWGMMEFDREKNSFVPLSIDGYDISGQLVYCAIKGEKEYLYMGTSNGVYLFDGDSLNKVIPEISFAVNILFMDNKGRLWIGSSGKGLYMYERGKPLNVYSIEKGNLSHNMIRAISQDVDGKIWVGTESGLNIIDAETNKRETYFQDFDGIGSINDNAIYSLYKDRDGNMWAGTFFGGINVVKKRLNHFRWHVPGYGQKKIYGKAVRPLVEDQEGNLWIGTEDGGLNFYDRKSGTFKTIAPPESKKKSHYFNIHSLVLDNRNLLIGSFNGGIDIYDTKSERYIRSIPEPFIPDIGRPNTIYSLLKTSEGKILVGASYGLFVLDKDYKNASKFNDSRLDGKIVYTLFEDSEMNLWIGTANNGIMVYNPHSRVLKNITKENSFGKLASNFVTTFFEDNKNTIWVGTQNGGLSKADLVSGTVTPVGKSIGMPGNSVYRILQDENSFLWISTDKGLVKYKPEGDEVRIYDSSNGLMYNQFNYTSALRARNGEMFFGSIYGMASFFPGNITDKYSHSDVVFTDLRFFGKSVLPGDATGILNKSIETTREIILKHKQSTFSIEFGVLDFVYPESQDYTLKLEGIDKYWKNIGKQRILNYIDLPTGKYVLKVKASGREDVLGNDHSEIIITILPPYYFTWWAYAIYLVLFALLSGAVISFYRTRAKERAALSMERFEKNKIKELNEQKLKFFVNVSHEFRTPLSLIKSPVDKLISENEFAPGVLGYLNLIKKNTDRLIDLVKEFLEFGKLEFGYMKLKVSEGDIYSLVRNVSGCFTLAADDKGIALLVSTQSEQHLCYFDRNKIMKILTNLISNAIKYTLEGGVVRVKASVEGQDGNPQLLLSVSDTGIGINPDDIKNIFNYYYRAENVGESRLGAGLGLAYSSGLVKIHKGTINVESTRGKGSVFTIVIPVSKFEYDTSEVDAIELMNNEEPDIKPDLGKEEKVSKFLRITDTSKPTIFCIDDNLEFLDLLQDMLSVKYNAICFVRGKDALKMLPAYHPELIISDIMMPGMDGLELCNRIKKGTDTSHIPVILLTAKSDNSNVIDGLEHGADLYITKPFENKELCLHVDNLVMLKKRMIEKYKGFVISELTNKDHTTKDEQFLNEIVNIILDHLGEADFNVVKLAKELAVSRSYLHEKLKSLTLHSGSNFINFTKTKVAMSMLENTDKSISEIAYDCGFIDPGYFSKCFKSFTGKTPSEFRVAKVGNGMIKNIPTT